MSCWCKKLWLNLYCMWPWVQMMQNQQCQCSDFGPGDGEWCRNFLFYLFLSGTHCGFVLPPVLISVSNNMSLSFQSDARLADRGFSATWEAVYPEDLSGKTPCKHIKTSIHSHLHTHTHTSDESCWCGCEPTAISNPVCLARFSMHVSPMDILKSR